jgi:Na+-transporting methylmalonyl-CoA/oxaloacetate decarboxylase gamma subunit
LQLTSGKMRAVNRFPTFREGAMLILVVLFFGLLIWMAASMSRTSRNSKLPEEIKMQRYQTKQAAKANTGGAIVVGAIFVAIIYVLMQIFPMSDKPGSAQEAQVKVIVPVDPNFTPAASR